MAHVTIEDIIIHFKNTAISQERKPPSLNYYVETDLTVGRYLTADDTVIVVRDMCVNHRYDTKHNKCRTEMGTNEVVKCYNSYQFCFCFL